MQSIATMVQQRVNDPEMSMETSQSLKKQLERLQENFATTVSTVKVS